jgi:hypothetical protein
MLRSILLGFILTALMNSGVFAQSLPPDLVAEKPKMYQLLGRPKVGSKFKHVEAEFPIPFDKKYSQLTEKQQEIYQRIYTWLSGIDIGADQTPPYPVKGLEAVYRPIIKKNLLVAKNKVLFFVADIDKEGIAKSVAIYSSPNREFNDFVNTLMFATEFEPGTCDGEPCAMKFPFEIDLRYVERNMDINGHSPENATQSQFNGG